MKDYVERGEDALVDLTAAARGDKDAIKRLRIIRASSQSFPPNFLPNILHSYPALASEVERTGTPS